MPRFPTATVPQKTVPSLSESAEQAYEQHRREGIRNNPAFNVGDNSADGTRSAARPAADVQTIAQKRTPEDDYKDLLQKAALADSTVEGVKGSVIGTKPLQDQQPIAGIQQQHQETKAPT